MDLKFFCLLSIVGVFSTESKEEDTTAKLARSVGLLIDFYKYGTPIAPGTSPIQTCIASSTYTPETVTLGVYALKAAGGTVFLLHEIEDYKLEGCFEGSRSENLTADNFESCADAAESSGWANSFSFVDDACVGYAAWRSSRFTQRSYIYGSNLVYVAENKIHDFVDAGESFYYQGKIGVSTVQYFILAVDVCDSVAYKEVTTVLGSQKYPRYAYIRFFQEYNKDFCSAILPDAANKVIITAYDDEDQVLQQETLVDTNSRTGAFHHLASGEYGELCVYIPGATGPALWMKDTCNTGFATYPSPTSFITYADLRALWSQIPGGLPTHWVAGGFEYGEWRWSLTGRAFEATDFVSNALPANYSLGECLVANASENYLLEQHDCNTNAPVVCLDFSAIGLL